VIEINDSCEFIEVPEFGTCVLRVFIQLIGILNWSLQHLADRKLFLILREKARVYNDAGYDESHKQQQLSLVSDDL
jgi:hypothetical protein